MNCVLQDFLMEHSCAKIIKMDICLLNTQIVQHITYRSQHWGWSADIVVDVFRLGVVDQVVVVQSQMDKTNVTIPSRIGGGWVRERWK